MDQPVGTGFSYSTDLRDLRHDEEGVSEDMYDFFQVGPTLFVTWSHASLRYYFCSKNSVKVHAFGSLETI